MTVEQLTDFISKVGYPIAMSVAVMLLLGWLGKRLVDSVTKNIDAQTTVLPEILGAMSGIKDGMKDICMAKCPILHEFDRDTHIHRESHEAGPRK